jgi:hypothetical protein
MYGLLNKILRSKVALWGIAASAIILFCMTAAITFGMNSRKQAAVKSPAEKIPSIQSEFSGLQVQNSDSTNTGTSQLQGQSGNGDMSQPAAPASAAPNAGLDTGIAASQVQSTGNTEENTSPASSSLSASLQPSSVSADVQAQVNAAGLNLGIQP